MKRTDTIIIGGGQAGLAMSHCLGERAIDHVVLERGRIAERWRSERWDSLTLLTPNWQTRLPGYSYGGEEPDGYMTMGELIDFIDEYARVTEAPVQTETTVTGVSRDDECYRVSTDRGEWQAKTVVIASGACNMPAVPALAENLPTHIASVTSHQYRHPQQLDPGGVLVVGASATGLQLAQEIHRSGRPVTRPLVSVRTVFRKILKDIVSNIARHEQPHACKIADPALSRSAPNDIRPSRWPPITSTRPSGSSESWNSLPISCAISTVPASTAGSVVGTLSNKRCQSAALWT